MSALGSLRFPIGQGHHHPRAELGGYGDVQEDRFRWMVIGAALCACAEEATMSGDYSRFTFDPRRNYSGVLLQQGRVLLDQDWNAQSAMTSRSFRAAVVDLLGRVFLQMPSAFKIVSDGRGG